MATASDTALDANRRRLALLTLAASDQPLPAPLGQVLLDMLGQGPEELERALAQALARCRHNSITRRVTAIANDRQQAPAQRRTALLTLGFTRSRDAADTLINLLEHSGNDPLRPTIFEALVNLSGITRFGSDVDQWQAWWDAHRRDNEEQWLSHLLINQGRRALQAEQAQPHVREQLVEVQRQLYRALPEGERAALLAAILGDPHALPGSRIMALELSLKMLTDHQPFTQELRHALVGRLDDPLDEVRQKAATLLRDAADESAADAVAERLLIERETSVPVLRAFLQVLARLPRAICLDAVLRFLEHADLRADAASALTAAADARLLTAEQIEHAGAAVRAQVLADGVPIPQYVDLLGRIGNDEDWSRIEAWLDDDSQAVKFAAARAWAQSDRPLDVLAARAGDPLIQPIVIYAAARRGHRLATMLALLEHRPEQEQLAAAWERALITMAGRLDPARVAAVQATLIERKVSATLREQILSAAVNRMLQAREQQQRGTSRNGGADGNAIDANGGHSTPDEPTDPYMEPIAYEPEVLVQLLMLRAALRLELGSPTQALADYERIPIAAPLEASVRRRIDVGMLEARLGLGDIDAAARHASDLLVATRLAGEDVLPLRRSMISLFLGAAQRALAADQVDRARSLIGHLRSLLKSQEASETELWTQVEAVERQIIPPATAPVTPILAPADTGFTPGPAPTLTTPPADDSE